MEKDLKIRISIDKKTGALKVVNGEFTELSKSTKKAAQNVDSFNKRLKDMAHVASTLYLAKKAFDFTKDISATGMELESMKMSLTAAVGTTKIANREIEFLKKTTDDLGLSFKASLSGFAQFAAAAKHTSLEGQGVENVFRGVSEASAVMGLSIDDQNGVFRALSQMMSKGKIQAEELRGQLGERLPGAFQIAARAMGMSTAQLDKFMESGKLLSDDFLPKFSNQLEKEFGKKAVNASKTARAEQNRYNNALLEMQLAISESGINELTKDYYKLSASLMELTTKNIPEIKSFAKEAGSIGASLIAAKVALSAYRNITASVITSNIAMSGTYGTVNRSILLATASTKAFSVVTRSIPYVALAAGIYELIEYFPKLTSETTLAQQAMDDYAKSVRDASKAQLDFEITKITKKLAQTAKLANDEARKRGAGSPVSGYGETLAYELTQLSKQLDILQKQKQAINGINKELETKNLKSKNKSWRDILSNMDASAYNDLNKMSMQINKKFSDGVKKEKAQWIKDLKEFYAIDIDKDLNDQNKNVEKTFQKWGDTLNSSISNSIVDAIQSGDVEGALQGLGSSIASSMIQASTSNLLSGSLSGTAALGMGGLGGIAAGAGITALQGFMNSGDRKSAEQEKAEYFAKIDNQTKSIVDALDAQTKILGHFGDNFEALSVKGKEDKARYDASVTKLYHLAWLGKNDGDASKVVNNYKKAYHFAYDTSKKYVYTKKARDDTRQYIDVFRADTKNYISSLLDVSDTYKNLSNDLKDVYDNLNGEYFATKKLADAQKELNTAFGSKSMNEYLLDTISGLDAFGTSITDLKDGLTSTDFLTQLDALSKLEEATGQSFDNNTAKALDYLDSIKLVGDAMAKSKSNIKAFEDSFKTPQQLAQDMAKNLGVTLATTSTGLQNLFESLKGGVDGLNDSEKQLLDANKALIDSNSKALNDAWLGNYSPLTMLQKTAYANSIANNVIPSTMSASEKALQALQQSQATATTDEQARAAFNRYVATLDAQVEDSTRTDIVNAIQTSNEKLDEVVDRLERIGA